MSDDKPTAADRAAAARPGCTCTAHCEHVHGDQAPTADEREVDRLRGKVKRLDLENAGLRAVNSKHRAESDSWSRQRTAFVANEEALIATCESFINWYDGGASPLNLHELLADARAGIAKVRGGR